MESESKMKFFFQLYPKLSKKEAKKEKKKRNIVLFPSLRRNGGGEGERERIKANFNWFYITVKINWNLYLQHLKKVSKALLYFF